MPTLNCSLVVHLYLRQAPCHFARPVTKPVFHGDYFAPRAQTKIPFERFRRQNDDMN
jgi:hypothetical protein